MRGQLTALGVRVWTETGVLGNKEKHPYIRTKHLGEEDPDTRGAQPCSRYHCKKQPRLK